MSDDHAVDINKHVRVYMIVFATLLLLTGVTVAVSYLDTSVAVAISIALVIATIKGTLVACYFMHLIDEKKLIYAVLALTIVFFVFLIFLPVLTSALNPITI